MDSLFLCRYKIRPSVLPRAFVPPWFKKTNAQYSIFNIQCSMKGREGAKTQRGAKASVLLRAFVSPWFKNIYLEITLNIQYSIFNIQ